RMLREKIPARVATLAPWLQEERDPNTVAAILSAFRDRPAGEVRPHLERLLRDRGQPVANRLLAAALFVQGLRTERAGRVLGVAEVVGDGPVLAELLRAMASRRGPRAAAPLLLRKLTSGGADVRAAALGALAALEVADAHGPICKALDDAEPRVRSAAAQAA